MKNIFIFEKRLKDFIEKYIIDIDYPLSGQKLQISKIFLLSMIILCILVTAKRVIIACLYDLKQCPKKWKRKFWIKTSYENRPENMLLVKKFPHIT